MIRDVFDGKAVRQNFMIVVDASIKEVSSTTADLCEHYKEWASKRTIEQRIREAERLGSSMRC